MAQRCLETLQCTSLQLSPELILLKLIRCFDPQVRLFSISDGSFCEPDWTEWDAPLCAPAALRATLGAQSFQAIEIEVVSAKGRRGTARIPVSGT